jgi:hypothetical protein
MAFDDLAAALCSIPAGVGPGAVGPWAPPYAEYTPGAAGTCALPDPCSGGRAGLRSNILFLMTGSCEATVHKVAVRVAHSDMILAGVARARTLPTL